MLAMVSLPFYLQTVLGRSEVETGLLLTPRPLATMVMAPLAGYLIERLHAGLLGALGMVIMAAGLFALVMLPGSPSDLNIIWPMILCGAGFGLFQSPNNHTIITSAPRERSGGASGMLGTARLLGQSTGAALVALMLNQFGDSGTHLSLLAAAIPATRGGGERFTYYATTRSGVKKRVIRRAFHTCQWAYYFRYSPLRSASMRLSSGGCVINSSLNDFDLPLIQNAIMLVASCGS